ncbi:MULTISPECIES: RNA polymerase sigma factor [Pseudoxanthomonas]|jgi:RNA polymerase sigma factor (sigma-70 family)|uniref:Transcriptional regulator n=1 Tax=Pseudoxanthomonas japonensis TaxID=69284 RepID=A0ABQ6ZE26_9GAMM|nr:MULTISPECIES: sigma-70 family RNA polymerase sigma factor [Pseudoxanthomonas]KAF1723567.1 transcriptional regulator [Pseudoxanthomonas japonensis]MCR6625970.1 sigma-70 family RNA polymerase sigma factor [Pseudoxanthomonas sp.]PZQ29893.1 MAG: sigma-70 family RNA polymerase sigma factor [Stenotrophomonas acidaminiphila]
MATEFDDWFVREVLVHERALSLFLQRSWPHRDEWHDLRQEVYARVYEAAGRTRPDAPKAFLFATARHLMTDRLRRSRVVSIEPVGDFESSNVYLIDEVSPERWTGTRQALKRVVEALDRLPDRCREVVWLRRVEELPQKDVASRLGISEKTVEKHLAKGMRLIADHLYGGDAVPALDGHRARPIMDEDDAHGRQQTD